MRESVVFYRSFYEAIKELPDEYQLEVFRAISEYSFLGEEPEMNGISKAIFSLIKPQIDANNRKYENGKRSVPSQQKWTQKSIKKRNES